MAEPAAQPNSAISRHRAALAFAIVGLLAGAAHVLGRDADSMRLWRETLPLVGLAGACLGMCLRPAGWLRGALVGAVGAPIAAIGYAIVETAMMSTRGEITDVADVVGALLHWSSVVLGQAGPGGAMAALAGAVAGWRLLKGR